MPDLQPPDLSRSPAAAPPPSPLPPPLPRRRVDPTRALGDNAAVMFAAARRVSICDDDAHDAVQAAAERFLKHRERVDPETLVGWLVTVSRNEALRVRERRVRTGAIDDDDRRLVHTGDGPEDVVARQEELELAREALGRLKPQERLALWMQAEGRSYEEIAEELSWTRTKVNRNISEGRASLRKTLAGIETGEGCAIAAPRIDRLASGGASKEDLAELRPHLRRCAGCRGRLRRARGGRWGLVPPIVLAWLPWLGRGPAVAPPVRARVTELVADRLATLLPATSGAVTEVGLAATTGLAVVALGVGVAAGGSADDRRPAPAAERPAARAVPASSGSAPVGIAGLTPGSRSTFGGGLPVAAGPSQAERQAAGERAARAAARERREARRERAARRRAAERARDRRAAAAAARRRAAIRSAPAPAAPTGSGPSSAPAPSSGSTGGSSTGGGSSSGGGSGTSSAASEFGFE